MNRFSSSVVLVSKLVYLIDQGRMAINVPYRMAPSNGCIMNGGQSKSAGIKLLSNTVEYGLTANDWKKEIITQNSKKTAKRSSQYRGVAQHRITKRYECHIWVEKKQVYLGSFATVGCLEDGEVALLIYNLG